MTPEIHCLDCGSTQITANKKGLSRNITTKKKKPMSTIKFVIGEEIEQKHRPYDPADPLNYRKVALKHNYIPGTISAYIYGRKQRLRKSEFREIPPNFVDLGLGTGEIAIVDYQYIE